MLTVFLMLLLAHLISDFILLSDDMAIKKQNLKLKNGFANLLLHTLCVFALSSGALLYILLSANTRFWWGLIFAAAIAASHFIIDTLKALVYKERCRTLLFLADQAFHTAVLYFAALLLVLVSENGTSVFSISGIIPLSFLKLLKQVCIVIGFAFGGSVLIKNMLLDIRLNPKSVQEISAPISAGKWIGILERLIGMILIALNQWAALGFIIAAKSLARHKQMEEKDYAEYFLTGTLLSMLLAIGGGLLLASIL